MSFGVSQTFITADELKQIVADALHQTTAQLPSEWDRIVFLSNQTAFMDIRGKLLQRGYDTAQMLNWDRGPEFQRDLGLYWSLVRGAGLHGYDDKFINKLDRRKELEICLVEIGGLTTNASNQPQPVQGGDMNHRVEHHWDAVTHWGWQGAYPIYDNIPPWPRGADRLG
jgi:hypothetical protein